jgi:hypothetical protein
MPFDAHHHLLPMTSIISLYDLAVGLSRTRSTYHRNIKHLMSPSHRFGIDDRIFSSVRHLVGHEIGIGHPEYPRADARHSHISCIQQEEPGSSPGCSAAIKCNAYGTAGIFRGSRARRDGPPVGRPVVGLRPPRIELPTGPIETTSQLVGFEQRAYGS